MGCSMAASDVPTCSSSSSSGSTQDLVITDLQWNGDSELLAVVLAPPGAGQQQQQQQQQDGSTPAGADGCGAAPHDWRVQVRAACNVTHLTLL